MLLSLIDKSPFCAGARWMVSNVILALLLLVSFSVFYLPVAVASPEQQQPGNSQVDQFLYVGDAFDVTFLQPTLAHKEWSTRQWRDEFTRLRKLGTRALVIQWSQYDMVTFYPKPGEQDSLLSRIASAAVESGLDFYTGLALNSDWAKPQTLDGRKIDRALRENKQVATSIHQHFGKHPNFLGWYIPQELTDIFYTDDQRELILGFFSELSDFLKELDTLKPILASGYTLPEKSHLVKFTMWWMRVFDESGIDTLIFQDSAGTATKQKWETITPYVEAISIIDDEYFSGDIWFVAEIFSQLDGPDINNRPFRAVPADFGRISRQLQLLGGYGKRIASYAYFPYMQPDSGEAASRLYQQYKQFVENRAANNKAVILGRHDDRRAEKASGDYFELGRLHRILDTPQSWERSAPHTLSVVESNADGYRYWGYYGLQDGDGGVGLARSNDLVNWEKYPANPLFENGRWPSVIKSGDSYLMMVTRDYASNSHIALFSSKDGLRFTRVIGIVPPVSGQKNQNPNLFYDANNGRYYLYWYSGSGDSDLSRILVRSAGSLNNLSDPESEQILLEEPYRLAAPNLFQHQGIYYLATEILEDAWKVRVYQGPSPLGPFKKLADNPVLDNGAACLFQHRFGDRLHAYYCKLSDAGWGMLYRSADL